MRKFSPVLVILLSAACDQSDQAIGPRGPEGAAGATGSMGATGVAGTTGATGADGETGPTGLTGATGAAGPAGMIGVPGVTGSTGPMGPMGLMGLAGPTGAGVRGPTGATGVAGATGPAGATGAGEPGPDGPTGATGPAGATGATGAGDPGPTGPTGIAGATGAAGATGPAGADGIAGPTGIAGATGAAGATGPAGADGIAGPTGPTGLAGNTGATGPAGPTGAGAPGPQGPAGATGSGALGEDPWGFAGFTAATYLGGELNGRPALNAQCAAEYTGGHFCHIAEYLLSNSMASIPAAGAWMDQSIGADGSATCGGGPSLGRYLSSSDCDDWTTSSASWSGNHLEGATAKYRSNACNTSRHLACCNGAPKIMFAGFTTAAIDGGAASGRPALHVMCNAEFAGSHFCHVAEYFRAQTTEAPPAEGAWIDASAAPDGTSANGGLPTAGRYLSSSDCDDWTTASASWSGNYLEGVTAKYRSNACNVMRRLACCF